MHRHQRAKLLGNDNQVDKDLQVMDRKKRLELIDGIRKLNLVTIKTGAETDARFYLRVPEQLMIDIMAELSV